MQDYNRVRTAASDFMALITPMVVMSASNFLSMDTMVCMEEARDDSLQLRVMQRFVQQMVKKFDVFNVFVWLDYISIAQRRIRQQAAGLASLPV